MTAPVEVTVACPNRASHGPQCQQVGIPKDRRCGRCGGYYGEPGRGVSAVLVGRDALVYAVGVAANDHCTTTVGDWFQHVLPALNALRTWDAGTEGGANGG